MIELGKRLDGKLRPAGGRLTLDPEVFLDNNLIVGAEGSGKTRLVRHLLKRLPKLGVSALVFDNTGGLTKALVEAEDLADSNRSGSDIRRVTADLSMVPSMFFRPATGALDVEGEIREAHDLVAALLAFLRYRTRSLTPEFVLLEKIVEFEWSLGRDMALHELIELVNSPPIRQIGAFDLETVINSQRRAQLATAIATLMDSPGLIGGSGLTNLDIESLLVTPGGSPIATVIALELGSAHVRQFVTSVLVAKLGTFVRSRWREDRLHLLVVVDEGGAVLPRGEPVSTTEPLLTIMDSWRGHGVGFALVAEEPAQLNDRALDLCQTWMVGRVPAARARQSVVDALDLVNPPVDELALDEVLKHLSAGQFVLRSPRLDSLEYFKTDDE